MKRKFKEHDDENQSEGEYTAPARPTRSKKRKPVDGSLPDGLPDRFFNEDGELDLRQVSGVEALKFMQAQGFKIPIYPRK